MISNNPALSRFLESYGIILVIIVMMAVLYATQPATFLSATNLTNILKQNAYPAMLALGMFVVIITAGIDLSVGSILGLAIICLAVADKAGLPWPIVLLVSPAVGILCGLFNGLGYTMLKLPHPFIMTLGTLYTFRGIGNRISQAPISGLQPEVRYAGQESYSLGIFAPPAGIPVSFFLVIICAIGLWFFLNRTNMGRPYLRHRRQSAGGGALQASMSIAFSSMSIRSAASSPDWRRCSSPGAPIRAFRSLA